MRRRKYEEIEDENGTVLRYARHENGGGLVESHAQVHPSVFLEQGAYVDRGAQVDAGVRIGAGSWIDGGAVVHSGAVIGSSVHVGRGAVIGRGARLGDRVKVGAQAHVWDNVRLQRDDAVPDAASVRRSGRSQRAA